jgi:hypothetical protein
MGGSEIRLRDDSNFIITIMGGTDILLSTMAEKILRLKKAQAEWSSGGSAAVRRTTVITFMGGTALKVPTIAQEIEEMMKLRESGAISEGELLRLWQEVIRSGELDVIDTYTLMGGTGEERPSTRKELRDLGRIAAKGLLSPAEFQEMQAMLKGEWSPQMRMSLLQQKIRTLLLPPSSPTRYTTSPLETPPRVTAE